MKFSETFRVQLGVVLFGLITTCNGLNVDKNKRQINKSVLDTPEDRTAEATGFGLGAGSVQSHSKYFQDFFTAQLAPHKIEFGHVCENPDDWEQRFERKDFENHRDQGKVRWGDKHGGYGEHYWDYNHAGHGDSHDEGSEQIPEYKDYDDAQNRKKRQPKEEQSLVYDPVTRRIFDKITGRSYQITEIN